MAELVPNSDVSGVWENTTGANYFGEIDEGSGAINETNYIQSTGNTTRTLLMGLTTAAIATASSVVVYVRGDRGSNNDTCGIRFRLKIGGVFSAQQTIIGWIGIGTYETKSVTFNESSDVSLFPISQVDLDSMEVELEYFGGDPIVDSFNVATLWLDVAEAPDSSSSSDSDSSISSSSESSSSSSVISDVSSSSVSTHSTQSLSSLSDHSSGSTNTTNTSNTSPDSTPTSITSASSLTSISSPKSTDTSATSSTSSTSETSITSPMSTPTSLSSSISSQTTSSSSQSSSSTSLSTASTISSQTSHSTPSSGTRSSLTSGSSSSSSSRSSLSSSSDDGSKSSLSGSSLTSSESSYSIGDERIHPGRFHFRVSFYIDEGKTNLYTYLDSRDNNREWFVNDAVLPFDGIEVGINDTVTVEWVPSEATLNDNGLRDQILYAHITAIVVAILTLDTSSSSSVVA